MLLDWVKRVKYLGCYFRSRTSELDTANAVGKFYSSFNNILNVLGKQRKEMLAVHLVKLIVFRCYCTAVKYGLSDQ